MWLVNFVYSESVTSGKIKKGGGSALCMWSSIFQGAGPLGQGREKLLDLQTYPVILDEESFSS